jgi:malate dehydrogenase (oxaloacetate-decarboxylating)
VNDEMKLAAARAIAACVTPSELGPEYIIPSVFNKGVAPAVAEGVARAAFETGLARRGRRLESVGGLDDVPLRSRRPRAARRRGVRRRATS